MEGDFPNGEGSLDLWPWTLNCSWDLTNGPCEPHADYRQIVLAQAWTQSS